MRPLAAALSLALVAPAHAGWFSHKEKQPSAEIPVDSSTAESSNDSANAPKSDDGHPQADGQAISALQASHLDSDTPAAAQEEQALPQVPGNSADDLSLSDDDANTDDGTDDNPDQARSMGQKARARVQQHFDINKVVDHQLQIYTRLLKLKKLAKQPN